MAYRFNPPPNWPIDDANWTPPPGWQPDPSWGPVPEGWTFWIQDGEEASTGDAAPGGSVQEEPEGQPETEQPTEGQPETEQPTGSGARTDEPVEVEGSAEADAPAAETDEYQGPDIEAGLAQAAPYESAQPARPSPAPEEYGQQYQQYEDYGQPSSAPGYGQASPLPGYGQASPTSGYGQTSADAPYGESSGAEWTATTATGQPPAKGVVARFWWVGCIVLFLVAVLIIAVVGGILLFRGGSETAGADTTTSQQEQVTAEEATTEDELDEPESPDPTTPLPSVGDDAVAKEITGENGTGEIAVDMEWKKAEDLPSTYGGTVEPATNGEYLVMTAQLTVAEGSMDFASYYFDVVTPYGGSVSSSSETYGLADSGMDYDSYYEFTEGETYTITVLYDFVRADGNTLQYDNYVDEYTWDIPA